MKKIISLLLVLVMMLGLVACGASKPAETEAPATEAPVVTEAPAVETEAAETEAALVVDTCILMEADNDNVESFRQLEKEELYDLKCPPDLEEEYDGSFQEALPYDAAPKGE